MLGIRAYELLTISIILILKIHKWCKRDTYVKNILKKILNIPVLD